MFVGSLSINVESDSVPCYVVFPRVIVELFLRTTTFEDIAILPVYRRFKECLGTMLPPAILLEGLCRICLVARFKEGDQFKPGQKFGTLFPFFHNSFIANCTLAETDSYCLPKMVVNKATTWDPVKMVEFLYARFPQAYYLEANVDKWNEIFRLGRKGALYVPAAASSSADAYVFWDPSTILAFQLKSGAQTMSNAHIVDECKKTFVPSLEDCKITLVVVAASFAENNSQKQGTHILYGSGKKLAYKKANQTLEYKIPANAEVIVLYKAGVEMLISSYNLGIVGHLPEKHN